MASSSIGLCIKALSTGYRRRRVIEHLTLPELPTGSVHALLGPNAAGKSTLLRALAGLLPAEGSISLGGRELSRLALAERSKTVTYMPQSLPGSIALTVLESVLSALRASPVDSAPGSTDEAVERACETLFQVGISHLAMEGLDHLSGGQRQLVSLAQALVRRPRLLLLDEPISALDLQFQLRVMQRVQQLAREHGTTVLVVLHDVQIAARWADYVIVLSNGKLAACGPPASAITPGLLAEVYNVSARVEHCSQDRVQVLVDALATDTTAAVPDSTASSVTLRK